MLSLSVSQSVSQPVNQGQGLTIGFWARPWSSMLLLGGGEAAGTTGGFVTGPTLDESALEPALPPTLGARRRTSD